MPDNREAKIVAAVACPLCGVGVGMRCVERAGSTNLISRSHQERRWAWQEQRGAVAPPPVRLCVCGHGASRHASERSTKYVGCDTCDCDRTREGIRAAQM